jgi:myo-inositol-1(or 4)-monophosphatase
MNFIDASINANKEVYKLIKDGLKEHHFEYLGVGAGGDKSSSIDIEAEKIFIKHLLAFGQIISEEIGVVGEGRKKIVIDPIDGSENLLSSFPYYGTSVALVDENGESEVGVICNLLNGEIFIKTKEFFKKGFLNDLKFSDVTVQKARIGLFERSYSNSLIVAKLASLKLKFRSPGALALSLAYANSVNFVIFYGKIREFDVKAGLFMCENLNNFVSEDIILISQDKQIFDDLKEFLLKREI